MKLDLRRPCPKCPFRSDVPGYLRRGRAVEIGMAIADGAPFACHETTVDAEDGSDREVADDSQFCAGAMIVLENEGTANNFLRMAERIGAYDAERLDRSAPVHGSVAAFVQHHGENGDGETCAIVNVGCEAPAGYLVGGIAVPAEDGGEVSECEGCGQYVCGSCFGDSDVCPDCAEFV